ncbi:hypothetical protein EJB05_52398, partial [Eragrostis curvula]
MRSDGGMRMSSLEASAPPLRNPIPISSMHPPSSYRPRCPTWMPASMELREEKWKRIREGRKSGHEIQTGVSFASAMYSYYMVVLGPLLCLSMGLHIAIRVVPDAGGFGGRVAAVMFSKVSLLGARLLREARPETRAASHSRHILFSTATSSGDQDKSSQEKDDKK